MSEFNEEKNSAKRAEEFLQVFKKGAEFTQELLKENERLRYQLLKKNEPQQGKMDWMGCCFYVAAPSCSGGF